jgi:hypothetical protein
LAYQLDPLPRSLEMIYDRWIAQEQRQRDKEAFSKIFVECTKLFSKTFVILDGFDDCPDTEKPNLLRILHSLEGCRLFLTTRQHLLQSLHSTFENASLIQISARPEDLATYIQAEVKQRAKFIKNDVEEKVINGLMQSAFSTGNPTFVPLLSVIID